MSLGAPPTTKAGTTFSTTTLSLPARDGRALHFLEQFAEIIERRYEDGRAILEVCIAPRALQHLHGLAADVRHRL